MLLPPGGAGVQLRALLLETAAHQGHTALLPPRLTTLRAWLEHTVPLDAPVLAHGARELLLLEALANFQTFADPAHAWALTDGALALFDELTLNEAPLPVSLDEFRARLRAGYGAGAPSTSLDDEARAVHALWSAWNRELTERGRFDTATAHVARLSASRAAPALAGHCYVADALGATRAEIEWFKTLHAHGRVTVIAQGRTDPAHEPNAPIHALACEFGASLGTETITDDYEALLADVYTRGARSLRHRAHDFSRTHPRSPALGRLVIHATAGLEQEARAIEVQVRRWYARGRARIAVVTNDRKLARRVRALLERAHITVADPAGWALSTAAAATALRRWCDCLEQDFAQDVLLDLLKSPFVTLGMKADEAKRRALQMEQTLVRRYGVTSGLAHYRAALARYGAALDERFGPDTATGIAALLDAVAHAAEPLATLVSGKARPPTEWIERLMQSLERLGLTPSYAADEAGRTLLEALAEMRAHAVDRTLAMTWLEFGAWLDRDFERRRFHPPPASGLDRGSAASGVALLGLNAGALQCFDALVLAGATDDHLPGPLTTTSFFNDGVRRHLGLPGTAQLYARRLHEFRCLLGAAPEVVITYRREQGAEALRPSAWVERLESFHHLAWGVGLDDPELHRLAAHPATLLAQHTALLPQPVPSPAGRLLPTSVPRALTASAHQRLLDCPYQFYAHDGLGLIPWETPHDEVEKSDYGRYVHRILQAFIEIAPGLPGPWVGPLDPATRASAEALLKDIARAVFTREMRRRYSARGWLYRFEALIPAYLDWEQTRRTRWTNASAEIVRERAEDAAVATTLRGRIDRLDRGIDGVAVIDYKTGEVPRLDAVCAGESVQLPFYALLLNHEMVAEVGYLALKEDTVSAAVTLAGAPLAELTARVRSRLNALAIAVHEGAALPAWGDAKTCSRCAMQGLCRKELWADPRSESRAGPCPR